MFRVDRAEAIFVDQHGLMTEPHLPGFFGDIFKNALTQVTRISWCIQPFGLFIQLHTLHHTAHANSFACLIELVWGQVMLRVILAFQLIE